MKAIRKTNKIYSVKDAKLAPSAEDKAKGIKLLTKLGFETYPNFMAK